MICKYFYFLSLKTCLISYLRTLSKQLIIQLMKMKYVWFSTCSLSMTNETWSYIWHHQYIWARKPVIHYNYIGHLSNDISLLEDLWAFIYYNPFLQGKRVMIFRFHEVFLELSIIISTLNAMMSCAKMRWKYHVMPLWPHLISICIGCQTVNELHPLKTIELNGSMCDKLGYGM